MNRFNPMRKLLTLAAFVWAAAAGAQTSDRLTIDTEQLRKLQTAEVAIANFYVDSVDQKKLVEDAI